MEIVSDANEFDPAFPEASDTPFMNKVSVAPNSPQRNCSSTDNGFAELAIEP